MSFLTPDRSSIFNNPSYGNNNTGGRRTIGRHHHPSFSPSTTFSASPLRSPNGGGSSRSLAASVSIDTLDSGYSDRFIPSRSSSNLDVLPSDAAVRADVGVGRARRRDRRAETGEPDRPNDPRAAEPNHGGAPETRSSTSSRGSHDPSLLHALLRSELLGGGGAVLSTWDAALPSSSSPDRAPLRESNLLRFRSPRQQNVLRKSSVSVVNSFNLSPVGDATGRQLLATPQKRKRKIGKVPFKVLDAPSLQDDFYLNLVDWSSQNVLAVGLGSCVYLWSACTSKVTKLCDLASSEDVVTSVSWTQRGTHLAVGTNRGEIQLWDATKCARVRTMGGHSLRIGTLSWNGPALASGSRDRTVCLRDARAPGDTTARLAAHKQEVCGLKWSFDEPCRLASGGNDNKLLVWDVKNHSRPLWRFAEHAAAVKAIAWSPHQHGLLASGGGTADRCIRFWNASNGAALDCTDTGSQVCNLAWSRNCNEIVSTHGYSLNQIVVWRYPSMTKVATLTGHTYRVLYLAVSPDGSTIVTGAGDETLRFWQVFPGPRFHDKGTGNGLLFPSSPGSIIR